MTHTQPLTLSHHQSCHSSLAHARTHTHTLSMHSREVGEKEEREEEREGTREVAEMSDQIPLKAEGGAGRRQKEKRVTLTRLISMEIKEEC